MYVKVKQAQQEHGAMQHHKRNFLSFLRANKEEAAHVNFSSPTAALRVFSTLKQHVGWIYSGILYLPASVGQEEKGEGDGSARHGVCGRHAVLRVIKHLHFDHRR